LLVAAACLGERQRPGPPLLTFTIDDTTVHANRADTVSGRVSASDPDGIDSVWVTVDSEERGDNGAFDPSFTATYRFIIELGHTPPVGQHMPVSFRARDVAGFQVQRDTYVVVIP
jgi:hypothetical protein